MIESKFDKLNEKCKNLCIYYEIFDEPFQRPTVKIGIDTYFLNYKKIVSILKELNEEIDKVIILEKI